MSKATGLNFNCGQQERHSWLDRALLCAELVKEVVPVGSGLVLSDIGCGDMKLAQCLSDEGVRVQYRGYDLLPQSNLVQKLDVQSELPNNDNDVITLLGVTEYLADLGEVMKKLSTCTKHLVVSHVVAEYSNYTAQKLEDLNWKNHLTTASFEELLRESGFEPRRSLLTANRRTVLWLCDSKE